MRKIFLYLYVLFIMPVHYTASSASTKTALENFAKEIKKNNTWLYKKEFNSISNEDLVKSYSLISSDIPEDLVKGQPTTDHKMIARCYIDNDTEGVSLWHSLERGRDLLDKILSSETNNGDIGAIFESLNNECKKMFDNVGCFTDEELKKHIKLQKKKLFTHIKKHIRLIPKPLKDEDITGLMKEGDNSVFLFFDQSKGLKERKNFLLKIALSNENIKRVVEENGEHASSIVVYSQLPKLDDEKLLGSVILGNADYRLIAVRNYTGQCGMYLTDTVRIPFSIEKSNNGKLMRFRISTIYPCDSMVYSKKHGWIEPFSNRVKMGLINPDTAGIVLDFLINYLVNYKNKGPLLDQYLQNIPLEKASSLDNLPVNVAKNSLWDIRNFIDNYKDVLSNSNNMKTTLEKIKNYKEHFNELQKTDINQSSLLSSIYKLKKELEADNLLSDEIPNISNMISLFTQIKPIVDRILDNEVKDWCTQIEKSFEEINVNIDTLKNNAKDALNTILELNDQISKLLSDLNKDEKQEVKTKDSINNIKTLALTNSLNNTVAENPPPVPNKKANNKNKKNNKPGDGSKRIIGKNDILVNANAQQIQKQQETLTANYREKYKKIHANINIIKAEAENYLKSDDYFLGDQKENEKKAQQLRDSLKSDKKILTNLEIMYSQIEDKRFIKDPNPIRETVKKVENNIYTICPPKLKSQ